ncbi:MAG: glycosyltransferase [Phycisphaerae bacterium]|nr:glycosyltransferase [Phycisphaerae bacterium]
MTLYPADYIILAAIVMQGLFTIQVVNNCRYALEKIQRRRELYRPRCVLIVPCRGLDEHFDENIESFYRQDYEGYHLWFVVQDRSDPAYERLLRLKARHRQNTQAQSVKILVAGHTDSCSQKLHNLLYACRQIPPETEALVFADSDACAGPHWLAHIVYPLRKDKNGAAGGYRCFVPQTNNLATVALSAVNAKICQLLGNTRFNLAWGGSMAILVKTFKELGIDKVWEKALSDDLTLTRAIRKKGLKMVFVPACMIASYESATWASLWEFARRQFIITRIYTPGMWLFGLFSALFTVGGLWGGLAAAVWAVRMDYPHSGLVIALPAVFLACQLLRAILRQRLIAKLLPADKERLRIARWADILFFWLWSILLLAVILSSAIGRTLVWRNIRYRIESPVCVHILGRS